MLFTPGITTCPRCTKPLYPTDDLFTVENWAGYEEMLGPYEGIYHYTCFVDTEFAPLYLSVWAERTKQLLADYAEDWPTLLLRNNFALVHKPMVDQLALYFLRYARELRFDHKDDFALLHEHLLISAPGVDPPKGEDTEFTVLHDDNQTKLAMRDRVAIELFLSLDDFKTMADSLSADEQTLMGRHLDLPAVVGSQKLPTLEVDCPIEAARGIVTKVARVKKIESVSVVLEVSKWKWIHLDTKAFEDLRTFCTDAKERVAAVSSKMSPMDE